MGRLGFVVLTSALLVAAATADAALLDSRARPDPARAAAAAAAWRPRPFTPAPPGRDDLMTQEAWAALLGDAPSALPGCERVAGPVFLDRLRASIQRVTGLGPDQTTAARLQAFLANDVLHGLYRQAIADFLASRPLVGEVVRCAPGEGEFANYRGESAELKRGKARYPGIVLYNGRALKALVAQHPERGPALDPLDRYLDTVLLHELLHQAGASHYKDIAEPRDIVSGAALCASGAAGDAPYPGPAATRVAVCEGALRDANYFQSVYGRGAGRWALRDRRRQSAGFGRPSDDPEGPPAPP